MIVEETGSESGCCAVVVHFCPRARQCDSRARRLAARLSVVSKDLALSRSHRKGPLAQCKPARRRRRRRAKGCTVRKRRCAPAVWRAAAACCLRSTGAMLSQDARALRQRACVFVSRSAGQRVCAVGLKLCWFVSSFSVCLSFGGFNSAPADGDDGDEDDDEDDDDDDAGDRADDRGRMSDGISSSLVLI